MGNRNKKLEIARESLFVVAGREGQPDICRKFKILLQLRIDVNSFLRVKSGNGGQEVMNKLWAGFRFIRNFVSAWQLDFPWNWCGASWRENSAWLW